MVDVIAEGFDAVLRIGLPADSRLSARKLGHFRFITVAAPSYLAQRGEPQKPADLLDHACLQYRFPSSGKVERWLMRGNDGETELPLPDFAIRDRLEEGSLREVLSDYATHTGVIHLLWPASKHPSPKLRVLIDFLSERILPLSPRGK